MKSTTDMRHSPLFYTNAPIQTYPLRIVTFASLFVFLFAFMAGSSGQPAQAQILTIEDLNNNLGTVNIATGTVTVIGNLGNSFMSDIAYSPTGVLYGTSFTDLYRINPATAAVTHIGSLGVGDANALVFGQDGTLYLASGNDTNLYTVNSGSGAATSMGSDGFSSAGDLAFNGGQLYLSSNSNQLVRINLMGGASGTSVGSLGFSNVFGLATASNGVLYGVSGTQIFSIDTTTGKGTPVLNYSGTGLGNAAGTTFITEAMPPAPEPSSLTILLIACLSLATLVVRGLRRVDA